MPEDNVVGIRQNAINFDAFREAMNASVNDPQKSGGKSVIRLAGADGVSTQKWVRLGTRSDAFKSVNLAARQALLNALLHETGAARVDDFPEGLKAALKLEDFRLDENGRVMSEKPLTARRIRCIATEVDKIRVSRGTILDSVSGSLDELFGEASSVKLNGEQREFLMDCLKRDLDRCVADDRPVPSANDIKAALSELRHPALVATFQRFGLDSCRFVINHRQSPISGMKNGAVFVSGAPADQVADRTDLLMMLLNARESISSRAPVTMALVSEKLPEMRRLQPEGPLTLQTVWKACFGKNVPAKLAHASGTEEVSRAFEAEARAVIESLRGPGSRRKSTNAVIALSAPAMSVGMTLSAAVKLSTQAEGFTVDVSRDLVAKPQCYNVEDATIKTDEEIFQQLADDFKRQNIVVTIANPDGSEKVMDLRNLSMFANDGKAEVEKFIREVDSFVGTAEDRHVQRNVVMFAFSQAGLAPLMSAMGVGGEHSDVAIRLSKAPDGRIAVDYKTTPTVPYDVSFGYEVAPDGSSRLADGFSVRRRDPEQMRKMEASVKRAEVKIAALAEKVFDDSVDLPDDLTGRTGAVGDLIKNVVKDARERFCSDSILGWAARTLAVESAGGNGNAYLGRLESIMRDRMLADFSNPEELIADKIVAKLVDREVAVDPKISKREYAASLRKLSFEDLCSEYSKRPIDGNALKAVITNTEAKGYLVLDGQGKPGFVATTEAYRKNYGGDDVLRRETNRHLANGVQKCLGLSEGPASRKARRLLRLDESPVPVVRSPVVRELNILAEKQKLCLEKWGTAIRYVLVDSEKAKDLKFGQSDFDRYQELSAERGDSMDAFFAFLMEKGLREADFVPRFKHVGEAKRPGNAEEERELMQANSIGALPENEDDIAPLNIDAEEQSRPKRSSDLNMAWEYLSVVNSLLLLLSE